MGRRNPAKNPTDYQAGASQALLCQLLPSSISDATYVVFDIQQHIGDGNFFQEQEKTSLLAEQLSRPPCRIAILPASICTHNLT
jgi:hypothetical protein